MTMPNFMLINQAIAEIWQFIDFQNGGHPPCWIYCRCIGTTHENYLMVFIIVQNLIRIDAVVLVMCGSWLPV